MPMPPTIAVQPYTKRPIPGSYSQPWFLVEFGNIQRAFPSRKVRTVTADTRLSVQDSVLLVDASGGPVSVTLPPPDQVQEVVWTIKRLNSGGNAVTLVGTVDGVTNPTLSSQYATRTLVSDGQNYYLVGTI